MEKNDEHTNENEPQIPKRLAKTIEDLDRIAQNMRLEPEEDFDTFGAKLTAEEQQKVLLERHENQSVFETPENFAAYIEKSPHKQQIYRRINARVFGGDRKPGVRMAASNDTNDNAGDAATANSQLTTAAVVNAAYELVKENKVDPGHLIPGLPLDLSLCQYLELADNNAGLIAKSPKLVAAFAEGAKAKIQRLSAQWSAVTGEPFLLDTNAMPRLGRILERRAPIPASTKWSIKQAQRDDEFLRAKEPGSIVQQQFASDGTSMTSDVPATASTSANSDDTNTEVSISPDENNAEATEATIGEVGEAEEPGCPTCSVDEVMVKAGARPSSGPARDRELTFPGTLKVDEHIFYDYGVVLPVDECGPFGSENNPPNQSLKAIKALSAQILSVTHSIDKIGFRPSFGFYRQGGQERFVLDDVDMIASEVVGLSNPTPSELQSLKRRLSEYAAVLRTTASRQLFLTKLGSANPTEYNESLRVALEEAEALDLRAAPRPVPHDVDPEPEVNELILASGGDTPTLEYKEGSVARSIPSTVAAKVEGPLWDQDHYRGYDNKSAEVNRLAPYLEGLGSFVLPRLQNLINVSRTMHNAVSNFVVVAQASDVSEDYKDFFTAEVSLMAESLADLMEEVAATLPRITEKRGDGSKRLGLLMVYRQRWIPEGYVRGKIVGHKNLPPDSEESLTRKSFINTLAETTLTEEFVLQNQRESNSTQKETSELVEEMSGKFGFSANVGGGFDIAAVGSITASVGSTTEVAGMSRLARNRIAESVMRSTQSFNEKREIKVTERLETEENIEASFKIKNLNKEITANYFYYQLLRDYLVTLELQDMRPVLLRKKTAPAEVAIDAQFIARYLHVLVNHLPSVLAADAVASVEKIDGLGRKVYRFRNLARKREVLFEHFRATPRPEITEADPSAGADYDAKLAALESAMNEAIQLSVQAEEDYRQLKAKADRVINHVREHRTHYSQYIWGQSPKADENLMLRQETFAGFRLPEATNGLVREGFIGDEEIFEYTGPSIALAELLLDNMIAGVDIVNSMSEEELRETSLFRQIAEYYGDEEVEDLVEQIRSQWFVSDPVPADEVLSSRRVQISQDAAVVEAMPGTVSLLEGYQLAQRYLAVEQSCLENRHLEGRIKDKTWSSGEDSLRVYRREGAAQLAPEEQ